MRQAIYLAGKGDVDESVERGLRNAGCRIYRTDEVKEALTLLEYQAERRVMEALVVLVAEIDAGGMQLLETLRQRGLRLPASLLLDRVGTDVDLALRAIRVGVREYLLPRDEAAQREQRTRRFVEESARRLQTRLAVPAAAPASLRQSYARRAPSLDASLDLRWDAASHTIYFGEREAVQLSPAEARTFEMLYAHRGRAVGISELIQRTRGEERAHDPQREIQLLRTHLARLRRRLAAYPGFGYRIENLRGAGYMML